jgi:hypothetical protein
VINANILITKNNVIDKNGINTRLFLNPGADKVLRVINKLVKEIVVLIPDKITLIIAISCAPAPVYLIFDENGVIKVQPDIVKIALLHFGLIFCFSLSFKILIVRRHNESDDWTKSLIKKPFNGTFKVVLEVNKPLRKKLSLVSFNSLNLITSFENLSELVSHSNNL